MKIIELDASDDIISICDRLTWAEAQQVLFVVPSGVEALGKGLDLVRLRRLAARLRVEIGLVTAEKGVRRQAQALGIPSFAAVETARRSRRGWWRGRRRREVVGLSGVSRRIEAEKRPFPPLPQPDQPAKIVRRWLVRYLAIFLFFISLALSTILFLYYVPRATLTLHPKTERVQTELQLTADPQQLGVAAQTIPARVVGRTAVREADIPITGGVTAADRDRLLAQTRQFLQLSAQETLVASLNPPEFLAENSLKIVAITATSFSHDVGQVTDRLRLRLEAEVAATAVNPSQATTLAIADLQTHIPSGYTLALDTVQLTPGQIMAVDDAGRVTFGLRAEAQAAATLDLPPLLAQTAGQNQAITQAYLFEQLPLRQPPELTVWPLWFQRLPYVVERIETAVILDN